MKRDENGKIVYSDNTTEKKPIISSEIKQLFKDYFQQKMSKRNLKMKNNKTADKLLFYLFHIIQHFH